MARGVSIFPYPAPPPFGTGLFLLVAWLLIIPGLYLAVLVGLAILARRPPLIPSWISPASLKVPTESVWIGELHAWWCPHPSPKGAALLVHGYAMNRSEFVPESAVLYEEGFSVLILETRSHGRSKGGLGGFGWYERLDVAAGARWLRERSPGVPLMIMGSSQGAAASSFALGEDPSLADALVLDGAYGQMHRAIRGFIDFLVTRRFGWIFVPGIPLTGLFLGFSPYGKDVAASLHKMGPKPVLFFHGERDHIAVPEEARRNLAALTGETTVVWQPKMGHAEGRWERAEEYHEALRAFVRRLAADTGTAE